MHWHPPIDSLKRQQRGFLTRSHILYKSDVDNYSIYEYCLIGFYEREILFKPEYHFICLMFD